MRSVVLLKSRIHAGGGLEKYTLRLADAFTKRKCSVSLITSGKPPIALSYSHFCTSKSSLTSVRALKHFDAFCAAHIEKADVIFGMDRNRFQTHLRAGNGVHAAYLNYRNTQSSFFKKLSFRLNPLHHTLLKFEKEAFEHPALQKLFTNSQMVKREVLDHYRVDPSKIVVVHNGVEWKEMTEDFAKWEEQKQKICKRWNLDPDVHHFLFAGHNFQRKGLIIALQALALCKELSFHLSIVGKDKEVLRYKTLVQKLGLEHKVTFFGSQASIRPFYQMADTLLIPSLYDPFANVTVEALAMGVFVVSSPRNGGSEVLTSENGIACQTLDPEEWAEALRIAKHKSFTKSHLIRNSVQHLDFSHQLFKIVDLALL